MDLYKVVIIASLLLLPGAGWMIKKKQEEIDAARSEIRLATRSGGYLEEIGMLQAQIETVENNRVRGDATGDPSLYFQSQILGAAVSGLSTNDITISPPSAKTVNLGPRQRVMDYLVKVRFVKDGKEEFKIPRQFLFAVLFNCESGGSRTRGDALPSIWKLRKLSVDNATIKDVRRDGVPPQPIEDQWIVKTLEFARREPTKG